MVRRGASGDDAPCGGVVASALAATPCATRLPHARKVFEDDSPLGIEKGEERLVAVVDGVVLGFVDYVVECGRIRRLYVRRDRQNRGIGSALLKRAEAACGGTTYVSTPAANDKAVLWYLEKGYRIVTHERVEDWYGGPVWWVKLRKQPWEPTGGEERTVGGK